MRQDSIEVWKEVISDTVSMRFGMDQEELERKIGKSDKRIRFEDDEVVFWMKKYNGVKYMVSGKKGGEQWTLYVDKGDFIELEKIHFFLTRKGLGEVTNKPFGKGRTTEMAQTFHFPEVCPPGCGGPDKPWPIFCHQIHSIGVLCRSNRGLSGT